MKTKQVDFQAIFFEYFRERYDGVQYRIRGDSNLPHDIAFLSGLLHDSRINTSAVKRRGEEFQISISRDRWELSKPGEIGRRSLASVPSRLTIHPVKNSETVANGIQGQRRSQSTITGVESQNRHSSDGFWTFVIVGDGWRWAFSLPEFDFKIELMDASASGRH